MHIYFRYEWSKVSLTRQKRKKIHITMQTHEKYDAFLK